MSLSFVRHARARTRAAAATAVVAAITVSLAACGGSGSPTAAGTGPATAAAAASGPVNVLYAGSLVDLMKTQVDPGFTKKTGYTVDGFAGGSTSLATQINGKVRPADVFISANPAVNDTLKGSWLTWYAAYATSPLVIGYNPKSRFAKALRATPWYDVVTRPGFRLGRTDPVTDPKGKLSAQALKAQSASTPALKSILASNAGVYPEETMIGRLQAGQLDAGFFYKSEAVAAGIPTVPLTGQTLKATYTVTVLNKAPHPQAATAFVKYLLGPAGRADLRKDGYALVTPPKVTGTNVPQALHGILTP